MANSLRWHCASGCNILHENPLGRPRQSLLHKFSALSDRPGRPAPAVLPHKGKPLIFR